MTTFSQNNIPVLHRKEWQMMCPAPVATGAGMFMVSDHRENNDISLYVTSSTVQYLYFHTEDSFVQINSGALAGTFGAGACGAYNPWSSVFTANGGSTTTITVAQATHNICDCVVGETVEFVTSTNASWLRRTITNYFNPGTGTITLTLDSALPGVVVSGDTFRISCGRFFVMNAGTVASGIFKSFELATKAWTTLATTNLPATWGTDGKMTNPSQFGVSYSTGTADSFSTTTIGTTTKVWTANQWSNYQVRITAGTGLGQTRHIVSNTTGGVLTVASGTGALSAMTRSSNVVTATLAVDVPNTRVGRGITVSGASDATFNGTFKILSATPGAGTTITLTWAQTAANQGVAQTGTSQDVWFVTPDATSQYVIEGCEEHLFLLGNAAVTMYSYSVLTNAWTVVSPGTARPAAPGLGMSADFVGVTGNSSWADESNIQNGRYLYSMRGGASALIDRYDLALGNWLVAPGVNYVGTETFTTGSSATIIGDNLYIVKEGTAAIANRFFKYIISKNHMIPFSTNLYLGGAAVLGNKMWGKRIVGDDGVEIQWLYTIQSTSTAMFRIMLY